MYTYKVEQAIKAASILHQDQLRKGVVPLPYVTHLMSVMFILRDYTTDENVLVAALLHDTLEDTDYTAEELREDFGEEVAKLVETVTEPRFRNDKKIPWMESKKEYAKQLRKGPKEAVMIAAADKAHNFRTIIDEYYTNHDRFLQDFGTDITGRLEAYQHIANAINNRLTDGIVHEFNHTFKAFKEFLIDVQENIDRVR
ncbi:MAG: bifunctional (p)ppGpp synthetase/guanosine-3',5'-bis(diphosphate) 3'-pyrophosphohydrolase [Candidatus Pacebacteria bacterium]|nr:bifunctional (p)ppGpp synthetase/guanosine-3',5'-bis(diphosphate) 3'-pyrophosphohydrolase [Candidatus Paceibacterota bacterium]